MEPAAVAETPGGGRTLAVAFSSETPVLRRDKNGTDFYEVLSHDPADADLSLLQNGGAFLDEHSQYRQIGSVQKAWIDGDDRKGRAIVAFGETPLGDERFELMRGGHRKDISFGYELTNVLSTSRHADGKPIRRFAWRALEISSVSVGADHFAAGVGRKHKTTTEQFRSQFMNMHKSDDLKEFTAIERHLLHDYPHLEREIKQFHARALCEGMGRLDYKRGMCELIDNNPPPPNLTVPVPPGEIGMGRRDMQQYSIARAIRSFIENKGKLDGFERDCHIQCERNSRSSAEGFFIPLDVVCGTREQRSLGYGRRDMIVGDLGAGGALVPTIVQTPMIELLRNRTVVQRLGATVLSGLTGNVTIPRQTAPATAQSLGEVQQINSSQATFDQVPAIPHRVGASTVYGKQLIFQSAPDVEAFVRDDLMQIVAIKHDALCLNGQGAQNEPTGILNAPNIGNVNFGGTATWEKVVEFETALGKTNADRGQMAYVTSPGVKGAWKTIAVALTGATTVSTRPLWESFNFSDGSNDGIVNGYRAASTNQIPGDKVLFGNWNDLILAIFGGFDMVVDPYTLAQKAEIVVTVNTWIDSILRHAPSFCVSQDAGNQ